MHYHQGSGNDLFYNLYNSLGWLNDYTSPTEGRRGWTERGQRRPLEDLTLTTTRTPWARRPPTMRATACASLVKGSPCSTLAAADIAILLKKTGLKLKIYNNSLTLIPTLYRLLYQTEGRRSSVLHTEFNPR
jgi:hypothetical protein